MISYYDAGPDHAAVRAAVHAWNTSGVKLGFVPTSRSRACVLIVPLKPEAAMALKGSEPSDMRREATGSSFDRTLTGLST